MKKVLAFLFICLSSTVMFGQAHWSQVIAPNYDGDYMTINTIIFIDGVEQFSDDLEIGVFVELEDGGYGDCRAVKYPARVLPNGHYYYSLVVKGQEGETYTYRLYDHGLDQEIEGEIVFTEAYPQKGYEHGESFGKLREPWEVYLVTGASEGYTLEIDPYVDEKDNYYLIASPVGAVSASEVEGLMTPSYDFYSFAQTTEDGKEWINHRDDAEFELQPGVGYLYANNTGTDLTFTGTPAYEPDAVVDIDLEYDANAEFKGWNLVGNPFAENEAYILCRPFYVLNGQTFELIAMEANGTIAPMTGAFVVAEGENDNVTFATTLGGVNCDEVGEDDKVVINVTNGRAVVDRAIVRFGQGRTLPKFQLHENSTKVYIPMDGQDYAIVNSANQGEMPVNFKAESNGTYTLSVNANGMNYLHLIDNRTGADVDLLANPSYTFDAQTSDYASRFRLVFANGNADDNFAFASNGSFIINNEGNATVQVIDLNGRILSTENINGSASINVSAAAGVYMIRLINGDNVKVQKIIVK